MITLPTVRVVSVLDGAFDVAAYDDGGKRYFETRDPALIKEVPGARLTWFHVRALPTSIVSGPVLEATSEHRMRYRAFQYGVDRIEHLIALDGTSWTERQGTGRIATGKGTLPCWTDEEMDAIHPAYVQEIGEVALRRAFFLPGSEQTYRLPPTSALAWAERVYRSAAALVTSTQSSAAHESADDAATRASAAAGDVTATASQTAHSDARPT